MRRFINPITERSLKFSMKGNGAQKHLTGLQIEARRECGTCEVTECVRFCVVRDGVTDIGKATADSIFRAVDAEKCVK